jgi:Fe-Mn family superoxide dismutase
MAFELPELPYPMDALEPHVSARTLEFHHGKHHAAYVKKLNELVHGTEFEGMELEAIIQKTADSSSHRKIFNNAGQHWNHGFFWTCMTPGGGGAPENELGPMIERDFGGFDAFRRKFIESAVARFGSGWAWLVVDVGKLAVMTTPNAEPPMITGRRALLSCDVWEHAYYLDYQHRRKDFVEAFLDHLVDWDFAAEQLRLEGEGSYIGARVYGEGATRFASSGPVEARAAEARAAVEGPEGEELRRAEEEGRRHSRGEDQKGRRT